MKWVTDCIGEEYKEWKAGDKVFITSPTGSGKTRFILDILLPHFSCKNQKVLYLVNRRILKEQIEMELSKLPYNQRSSIKVELYQSIENKFCTIKYQNQGNRFSGYMALGHAGISYLSRYDCVVCDECHYFLADSNYNTNTVVSFRMVNDYFKGKIRIFMSATIDGMKRYIQDQENKQNRNRKTNIYGYLLHCFDETSLFKSMKDFEYTTDIDYNYLDIRIINNKISDIIDLVKESNDKWLIFVDNISFGMELKRELIHSFKETAKGEEIQDEKVVLLSSKYEKDEESVGEVNRVIEKGNFTSKVIISTSVMDNGINIEDPRLRNMIVIADNEVEFIQMIGRKRRDGQRMENPAGLMYVLTNTVNIRGAAAILYPGVLKEIAGQMGGDFIIFLSSIHETILAKAEGFFDWEAAETIVREINRKEVAPEDVLSDTVYYYNEAKDCIMLARETGDGTDSILW